MYSVAVNKGFVHLLSERMPVIGFVHSPSKGMPGIGFVEQNKLCHGIVLFNCKRYAME